MHKNFLFLIGLAFVLAVFACSDQRLVIFLEEYKEMKTKLAPYEDYAGLFPDEWKEVLGEQPSSKEERDKDEYYRKFDVTTFAYQQWMKSSKSPFAPYLDKDFHEGLNVDQAKLYQSAVKNINCTAIRDLELEGFLNFYPFLRPAFAHEGIEDISAGDQEELLRIFRKMAFWRSLAAQYCREANEIKETFDFAKRYRFIYPLHRVRYFDLGKISKRNYSSADPHEEMFLKRCWAIGNMIKLAIFDRYRPAMIHIFHLMKRPDGMTLPADMEYYLRKVAGQLDIKQVQQRSSDDQKLRTSFSAKQLAELDDQVRLNKPSSHWGQRRDCWKVD